MEKKRNRYSMDYEDQDITRSSGTTNQNQSSRKSSSRTADRNNSYKSTENDPYSGYSSSGYTDSSYGSTSQKTSGTAYRSPSQGSSGAAYRSPSQGSSGAAYRSPSRRSSGTAYRSPSQGSSGTTYRSPSQGSSGTAYRDSSAPITERLSRPSEPADERARKKRRSSPGSNRTDSNSARRPADRQRAEQRKKERREWARWQRAHWIVRTLIVIVLIADILVLKFGGLTGGIPTVISLIRTLGTSDTETTQTASVSTDKVTIDEQLLTINEYSRPGIALDEVNGLVIHYIGNAGSTAQENRDYFENLKDGSTGTYASCNYIVGLEGEVIRCVPDNEVAYASGERNSDTLSIEFCHPDDTGCPGESTNSSLVLLCAQLCDEYNLDPTTDIIRHYDISEKSCPKYFVDNPDAWTAFLQQVAANM